MPDLAGQFLRFALVGVLNTGVHLAVVAALVELASFPPVPSNGLAFVTANAFSFWANSRFTFRTRVEPARYGRFLVVSLAGLALALSASRLAEVQRWHYLVGVLLTCAALPILSFAANRWWTWGPAAGVTIEPRALSHPASNAILLGLATLAFHGGALASGWAFDDPAHLWFASRHAPWDYFTRREVMLEQSYAHISPWNALFYDLGLPLFGLQARGHHVHLLLVVWACAVSTWWLARRWMSSGRALAAGLLWLAWPATATIARFVMTGHYAYGLLLSVLSLLAFDRSLRDNAHRFAWAAAGAYAGASLCKELYVPLIAALAVWPRRASFAKRMSMAGPSVLVALGYVGLRMWVLGGVGGYATLHTDATMAAPAWKATAASLFDGLRSGFGISGPLGLGALGIIGAIAGFAVLGWGVDAREPATRPHLARWLLFLAAAGIALAVPLVPAYSFDLPYGHERVLIAAGWALALLLAGASGRLPGSGWWLVVLAALMIPQQRAEQARLARAHRERSAELAWIVEADASAMLVPDGFYGLGYFDAMREARRKVGNGTAPAVVQDLESFLALPPEMGRSAWAWNLECACVEPLGDRFDRRVEDARRRLAEGQSRELALEVRLQQQGLRYVLSWSIDAPPGKLWFDLPHWGRRRISREGSISFGLDHTAPMALAHYEDPAFEDGGAAPILRIRITLETPDGAWVRSPLLQIPMAGSQSVAWRSDRHGPAPSSGSAGTTERRRTLTVTPDPRGRRRSLAALRGTRPTRASCTGSASLLPRATERPAGSFRSGLATRHRRCRRRRAPSAPGRGRTCPDRSARRGARAARAAPRALDCHPPSMGMR